MAALIGKRLVASFVILLAISAIMFFGIQVLPGDVATAILGQDATPESVAAIRLSLHLNDPIVARYWEWLSAFIHGDLGRSLVNNRPVSDQLLFRLSNSFFLAACASAIAIPVSLVLGIVSAVHENTFIDRFLSVVSLGAVSLPNFFLGYLFVLIFSVKLQWLPSLALTGGSFGNQIAGLVMPVAVLALGATANTLRLTRTTTIAIMSRAFIEMAFLKGLPRWRVVVQHALPNAIGPIASVVALTLAWMFVGVVVVEVVFVYPGIGQLMVDAVSTRDIPVVQACGVAFAAVYISLNFLADFAALLANPRLRTA